MEDIFLSLAAGTSLKKKKSETNGNSSTKKAKAPASTIDLFGCISSQSVTASKDVDEVYPDSLAVEAAEADEDNDSSAIAISDEELRATRNRLGIKVMGSGDIPELKTRFADIDFHPKIKSTLLENIETLAVWKEPSPVQMQAIPALLGRRDVLAIAPTGSGKTGAYVLPMLSSFVASQGGSRGIHGLILVPTRELSEQVYREMLRLSTGKRVDICCLNSNVIKKATSFAESIGNKGSTYFAKFDVLISTPMRLLSVINAAAAQQRLIDLSHVGMIILDEVDKLFENDHQRGGGQGDGDDAAAASFTSSFLSQVDSILAECPGDGQGVVKGLFSATITPFVQELANGFLAQHLTVQVGTLNATASTVKQSLQFCGNEQGKLFGFRQLVTEGKLRAPALLFVQSIDRAKALHRELAYDGVNIDAIHSDLTQPQRDDAIRRFRSGETWVLICTDLLARGIDFKHINLVINYDLPTTPISYIHRIGRTGRAGRSGEAITFFVEQDIANLRSIANVMKISGCDVPDWMLTIKQLSTKDKRNIRRHCPKRHNIGNSVPKYDEKVQKKRKLMIENSKKK